MQEPTIVINDSATVAYSAKLSAAVSISSKKQQPTTPLVSQSTTPNNGLLAYWGENNLFPQDVIKEVSKNTIIGSTLDWKARALYAGGLVYGESNYDDDGKDLFFPKNDPGIYAFLKSSNTRRFLIESCTDFYWFYNTFPELITSKDRKKIVAVSSQEASYCRWGLQSEKSAQIDYCYIKANWEEGYSTDPKYVTIVPVIDPYINRVEALRERKDGFKYIYPVSYPTPGKTFYQLAHWNSLRESKWLDVAQSIPAFKKALFKNQISLKYLIEVSTWWWNWKYSGFDTFPSKQKSELMTKELEKFEKFMSGAESAGNSLMVTFHSNPEFQKEYPGWKITPIDNKIKDGIYIEDSQEASSHLLYALGVDPTLVGNGPGKLMGAGSGSDKRVAFNVYISLCQIHQDLILEPLEFIADYNGWDKKIKNLTFKFRHSMITTLDKGTEVQPQQNPKPENGAN